LAAPFNDTPPADRGHPRAKTDGFLAPTFMRLKGSFGHDEAFYFEGGMSVN
jgi:hypothetical protein